MSPWLADVVAAWALAAGGEARRAHSVMTSSDTRRPPDGQKKTIESLRMIFSARLGGEGGLPGEAREEVGERARGRGRVEDPRADGQLI